MNDAHLTFLASEDWGRWLDGELLPWLDGVGDLGDDVLEVGPGPGLTTDRLRSRCRRLTAVELDPELAAALATRMTGTNVEVVCADATETDLPADRFSGAASFSMLHHVPSPELQDRVFAEVGRVLRPGGLLVVSDSLDHEGIRQFHEGDVFVPLDPSTLDRRLEAARLTDVSVDVTDFELRFSARKR